MNKIKIINSYPDYEFIFADGFDDAILGVADDFCKPKVIYSVNKCLDILMDGDNMDFLDAREYFQYNVSGAYIENGPIWCWDIY